MAGLRTHHSQTHPRLNLDEPQTSKKSRPLQLMMSYTSSGQPSQHFSVIKSLSTPQSHPAECTSLQEVSKVAYKYRHFVKPIFGFQRRVLGARLSGQRLVNFAHKFLPPK